MANSDKISRRAFASLAAAVVLPAVARPAAPARQAALVKPPRLRFGDTIGLVAPGGHTNEAAIAKAVAKIEQLGFRVREGANLRAVHGNYAGSVRQRVDDLHAMFLDPGVKAIWCIRGGAGCIALLSTLDYKLIRANPTILLGYSDISALQLAMLRHAGLVTFHGPVASSSNSDYSTMHMLAVLMDPQPVRTIAMALENKVRAAAEPHFALRTVTHGQATGRLVGGNLSVVSALCGTPYQADVRKAIVFLEDVNEEPYRIDRALTQLDLASGLRHAAGVMFGVCVNCGPKEGESALTLEQTLDSHLAPLPIPTVSGYSFGHIRSQFTLPLGVLARLDTDSATLTLLEAAVR